MDRRPLSPASLAKCEDLLMQLARFYKYHGINIKTCYADFDKHHIGVVTESQVYILNISIIALINMHHTVNNCSAAHLPYRLGFVLLAWKIRNFKFIVESTIFLFLSLPSLL